MRNFADRCPNARCARRPAASAGAPACEIPHPWRIMAPCEQGDHPPRAHFPAIPHFARVVGARPGHRRNSRRRGIWAGRLPAAWRRLRRSPRRPRAVAAARATGAAAGRTGFFTDQCTRLRKARRRRDARPGSCSPLLHPTPSAHPRTGGGRAFRALRPGAGGICSSASCRDSKAGNAKPARRGIPAHCAGS